MGNQANILSFDEVKRDSGAMRSSAVAPSFARRRPLGSAALGASAPSRTAARAGAAHRGPSCRPSDAARISGTASAPSITLASTGTLRTARASSARACPLVDDFPAAAARPATAAPAARSARPARDAAPRAVRTHARQVIDKVAGPAGLGERLDERRDEDEAPEKRSRVQEFRRKRQKDRADKKFDKQFGGSARTSDAASAGPRAAVYKGEMGSKHKRAARMQNEAAGKTRPLSLASLNPLALLTSGKQSPRAIAGLGVAVCLLLSCWFLYTPAQQLYQSVREHDRLEAEYAAIEQRNASLESEVGTLQTDAGVEDRAHEQFGWVPEGYQTANVHGLTDDGDEEASVTANIVAGSVEAPETWYSPVLDALFGVK